MAFSAVCSVVASSAYRLLVSPVGLDVTSMPVSYTHLDVYKRQGYACAIATVLFVMMVGVNLLVQKLIAKVGE